MLISIILIVYCQAEDDEGGEDGPSTTTVRTCTCGISDSRDDLGQQKSLQPHIKKEPGGNYRDNDDNSRGSQDQVCTNNKRLISSSGRGGDEREEREGREGETVRTL